MRRFLPLLIFAVLLTVFITSAGLAQEISEPNASAGGVFSEPTKTPEANSGENNDPLPETYGLNGILALAADEPSDTCADASDMFLTPELPVGSTSYDVEFAKEADDDPILSCMWGNPSRSQGYRTIWYRLVVPFSGSVGFDTFSSAYDTVLSIHKGECGALVEVRCNDDANGFTSATTLDVSAGEIYYIEVADWQPGLPGAATLNFSAFLEPVNSRWERVVTKPLSPAITRHATAAEGGNFYVIGGQTGTDGAFLSNKLQRLNTSSGDWTELASIPGPGYSSNTAALVNGRIYVPSGFNGSSVAYDGRHWSYDIGNDAWTTAASIPLGDLPEGRYFGWSASAVPPSNSRYYLMGGTTTSTDEPLTALSASAESYVYIQNSDAWLKVDPMQTARYAHTGAWVSANNLGACAAGGLSPHSGGGYVLHTSAECYQPGLGWRYIGDMNIPRYGAGSTVGPDGKWYVFGGKTVIEGIPISVLRTEVYDPNTGLWSLLPPEYNLSGQELRAARSYTSGSLVGNDIYVTGGSILINGNDALPLTEKMSLSPYSTFVPAQFSAHNPQQMPDDTFAQARLLPFGFEWYGSFDEQLDFYDFFSFVVTTPQNIRIELDVPDGNNFDLYLYDPNKLLWAESASPLLGVNEVIVRNGLQPEPYFYYYVMVKRSFPTGQPDSNATYKLVIRN